MPTRTSPSSRAIELVHALETLSRRRLGALRCRRGHDVTLTRLDIRVLGTASLGEPWTMGALARDTGLSVSGLTAVVNRLVARGYLERRRSDQDRRIVWVELTARGRQLREQARRHRQRIAEALLAPLGEREQRQFLALMQKIARANPAGPVPPRTA